MRVVAGLNLSNLHPRVWEPDSPYYLPELQTVMVSYAEFHRMRGRRGRAIEHGLHDALGIPQEIPIYLDNGAFSFLRRNDSVPFDEYDAFVSAARPDWYPVPRDVIPRPDMSEEAQRECLDATMEVNRTYAHNGHVPVIHAGTLIERYVEQLVADPRLRSTPALGLGGLVPNLLRSPRALPYQQILAGLQHVRDAFPDTRLHLFGVGGTATLHLAALLRVDSADSSGWRSRAARGIVQLPGRGDRMVAELGKWRGRVPSDDEWEMLRDCQCPACQRFGIDSLRAPKLAGFCHRATHNLWTLLDEARQIDEHLADGTYLKWYGTHVSNSTYLPLIQTLAATMEPRAGQTSS